MKKMTKKIASIAACSLMLGTALFPETGLINFTDNFSITASAAISNSSNLKNGSRGTQVKYLQINLNVLNYNAGSADGIFGNSTKNAVIRFQRAYGLSADGIAGKNTINKMNSIAKQLQSNLNSLGYSCGAADGILGANTVNALKKFQRAYGLSADGIAGPQTLNKINSVKASKASAASKGANKSVNTTANKKYIFKSAYNYAKSYWNKRNYKYNYYSGNNCANFVSQCLVAAGIPTNNTWKNGSYAFINTTGLRNYFGNSYKVSYKNKPKVSDISVGDVIYTNNGGHVMFVMAKSGNTIKASGNTNNRDCITIGINGIYGVLKTSLLIK